MVCWSTSFIQPAHAMKLDNKVITPDKLLLDTPINAWIVWKNCKAIIRTPEVGRGCRTKNSVAALFLEKNNSRASKSPGKGVKFI